ncbi:hypothetical protein [Arthrobacter sp. lap29]|uniref:hypothetical protein n=1 Tax=Arthrobacter sp. lap29 TaxID=3056122 RepID=UPI0028F72190|nr:hypothetical protein [Arthrobacter sp. lap29]
MAQREIKRPLRSVIGSAIMNGYGGGKSIARTVTFNVDEHALYEVMQAHAELNSSEGNLYSSEFNTACHRDWVARTGRGINEGERDFMVQKLMENRRLGTHDVEIEMVIDYMEDHEDLIERDDPTCRLAVDFVTTKVATQILRQCSRRGHQRALMEAQSIWERKFGDPDEQ